MIFQFGPSYRGKISQTVLTELGPPINSARKFLKLGTKFPGREELDCGVFPLSTFHLSFTYQFRLNFSINFLDRVKNEFFRCRIAIAMFWLVLFVASQISDFTLWQSFKNPSWNRNFEYEENVFPLQVVTQISDLIDFPSHFLFKSLLKQKIEISSTISSSSSFISSSSWIFQFGPSYLGKMSRKHI